MTEPRWLTEGRKYIGTKEIPGVQHDSRILSWWKAIKRGGIKTDEVPWCAAFVGAMLEASDITSSRYESAKSYLQWGVRLDAPTLGCVVVFDRSGGGHVGFVVGKDDRGRLMVLGGNQGNAVSIAPFDMGRVAGYRWPTPGAATHEPLPMIASNAISSRNEA